MYDIGGEIYVPSKCSQNTFTLVSWDVFSVVQLPKKFHQYTVSQSLKPCAIKKNEEDNVPAGYFLALDQQRTTSPTKQFESEMKVLLSRT